MVQLVPVVDVGEQETVFELMGRVSSVMGNIEPTRPRLDVVLPPH
jgi:hypothetical protein